MTNERNNIYRKIHINMHMQRKFRLQIIPFCLKIPYRRYNRYFMLTKIKTTKFKLFDSLFNKNYVNHQIIDYIYAYIYIML